MDTKDKGITQEICHSYQSLLGMTEISHWESSNKVIIQKKCSNNHLDSQYTDLGSRMQMAVEVLLVVHIKCSQKLNPGMNRATFLSDQYKHCSKQVTKSIQINVYYM